MLCSVSVPLKLLYHFSAQVSIGFIPFCALSAAKGMVIKMKNKVIGCFRSKECANDFLLIKSFTSTAAKNGFSVFRALFLLLSGQFTWGTE